MRVFEFCSDKDLWCVTQAGNSEWMMVPLYIVGTPTYGAIMPMLWLVCSIK